MNNLINTLKDFFTSVIEPIGKFGNFLTKPHASITEVGERRRAQLLDVYKRQTNNFYPILGNHDWLTTIGQLPKPYLDYFSLPGNERYYDFIRGPVHFFAVDSDINEPDGITSNSIQGQWLQSALSASTSPWNVVYLHHSPYSSGLHGSNTCLLYTSRCV